jgi:hypothetical protein
VAAGGSCRCSIMEASGRWHRRKRASRRMPPAERRKWQAGHTDTATFPAGGWLRPSVFGAVDGLVTNVSLISGRRRVSAHGRADWPAALAAGAFSMGTGEYISVTNQNELVHSEIALERQMHGRFPAAEREELAGYFRPAERDRSGSVGAGQYSRKVPQPTGTLVACWGCGRTVTCGDELRWMSCLLMACKRSGVRIPIAPRQVRH